MITKESLKAEHLTLECLKSTVFPKEIGYSKYSDRRFDEIKDDVNILCLNDGEQEAYIIYCFYQLFFANKVIRYDYGRAYESSREISKKQWKRGFNTLLKQSDPLRSNWRAIILSCTLIAGDVDVDNIRIITSNLKRLKVPYKVKLKKGKYLVYVPIYVLKNHEKLCDLVHALQKMIETLTQAEEPIAWKSGNQNKLVLSSDGTLSTIIYQDYHLLDISKKLIEHIQKIL